MTPSTRHVPPAVASFPALYARTGRFTLGTPRNISVVAGGRQVLFCRPRDGGSALCLWALDTATGTERLVVDPADLTTGSDDLPPAEQARRERARESASGIVAYSTDEEATAACFALSGQLYIVDLASGAVTAPRHEGAIYDPRLNRQGTAVAYVAGQALRVLNGGPDGWSGDRELRSSPDPLVGYGRAEFIAAEEMDRSRGYWWSPDGSCLAVTRVDESPVERWWITDPAHPEVSPNPVRFPSAGTANAIVGLEVVDLDGGASEIDWSDGGRFEYLAKVVWSPRRPLLVVRQTRDQKLVSIAEVDLDDLTSRERHRIVDDTWVELFSSSPRWCANGLLTIEDGAGARSLFLDGKALTSDELYVRSIVGAAGKRDDEQVAIITASTDPTEIHLVAVPLGIDGAPSAHPSAVLTTEPGVHSAQMAGPVLAVTTMRPGAHGSRIDVHRFDPAASASLPAPTTSITSHSADPGFAADPMFLTLGGDDLRAALFLPSGHDGSEPLPVLLDPYGGPHSQRVLKTHNAHLVSRWFAEHGYGVLVVDGRGTPGRGPGWERAVWGDLAGPVLDDQLVALDAALARFDVLDGDRVGIRGWSFGGYLAALAVLRRPDRFHAAVAGAPVTAWRLYDTHYTERYLGHPDTHPDHYRRSDLLPDLASPGDGSGDGAAARRPGDGDGSSAAGEPGEPGGERLLRRPLLLVHGLADDNVVAAHTLRLSSALLADGSPHQVLPLSGVTHMASQVSVAENLLRLQLSFLDETIGASAP